MIRKEIIVLAVAIVVSPLLLLHHLFPSRKTKRRNPDILWKGPSELIGDTPIIYLPKLSKALGCKVLGKCEFMNPGGTSKDRVAKSMICDAEAQGLITEGGTIYEGTVGSTGIALAWLAASNGYNCHICIPDDQSAEKYKMLEAYGATVEKLRPASIIDPNQFVNKACRRAKEDPNGFFANQFENLSNYEAHYTGTADEIYDQTGGNFDYLVMGCGTGGTLAGCTVYLKHVMKHLKVVLADPQGSGLFNKVHHNTFFNPTESEGKRSRHQVDTIVEGVGINRMTQNLSKLFPEEEEDDDHALVDDAIQVSDKEAVLMSRYMARKEGLFLGSSTCVNLVAVCKLSKKIPKDKTILTILCDAGHRHLNKFWSDEYLIQNSIITPEELNDMATIESLSFIN